MFSPSYSGRKTLLIQITARKHWPRWVGSSVALREAVSGNRGSPDLFHRSLEAGALWRTMSEAYAAVQTAHLNYDYAITVAADTENLNSDGIVALRHQGQAYAHAVAQYSKAVIAWLSFADEGIEEAATLGGKTNRSGENLRPKLLHWPREPKG